MISVFVVLGVIAGILIAVFAHKYKGKMLVFLLFYFFANKAVCVSPLSCVSCVPASCVHIWFVSCPCLV